jgi:4-diphosphocytidyl-2-C-methyl-D-erythritol kinase
MTGREYAWAKLNLSLDVHGKLPNGYHDLTMVMASVDLCDDVEISLRDDGVVVADCGLPWLPNDERNLAVRAARAFFQAVGMENAGADIRIKKRIPVGAGMAGGSTDAAAVLRGLNVLTGAGLSADKLREIGLTLGSDVPYCISGGVKLAQGQGEILSPLPDVPDCYIVICKPPFSISTGELFARVDSRTSRTHPDTSGVIEALEQGNLPGLARRMYNVFEDVLPRRDGEIAVIRSKLLELGALGSVMTGTGSAVFGLYDREDTARKAYDQLKGEYKDCFLTRAIPELEV